MLRNITLVFLAAALLSSAPLGAAVPGVDEHDKRDLAAHAKISMKDAISKALEARAGSVVEVELEAETEGGKLVIFYEVVIVTANHEMHEVAVHAVSGKILEVEKCDDPDERAELAAFRHVLRHAELGIPALLAKAGEVIRGTPVEACFEMEDGHPVCEIIFVNGRYLIDVDLEARAGHLLELELVTGSDEEHEDRDSAAQGEEEEDEDEGMEEDDEDENEDEDEDDDEHEGREHAAGAWGPAPTPLAQGVKFSSKITHPYFPLSSVRQTVLVDEGEKVIREVLRETRTVAGVTCLVLAEKEYEDGELAEISYNLFAQDPEGNVFYFGEDVDDYKDGKVVGHGGAWMVGKNATEPCLFMPAKLQKDYCFKRENSPPAAEEFDQIVSWDATVNVPAGQFKNALVIREGDVKGKWIEKKLYAKGVGLISENGELNLVELKRK